MTGPFPPLGAERGTASGKRAIPLDAARAVAHQLRDMLAMACDRIEVAGSIRRARPIVGDIEIVATSRVEQAVAGLWGDIEATPVLPVRIDDLIADHVLDVHPSDPKRGPRYAKLWHVATGMQVDLFTPERDSFGLMLVIRTGPAAYSQRLVTDMKRGPRPHHVAEGQLHRGIACWTPGGCEVVAVREERDLYAAIGVTWTPPERR